MKITLKKVGELKMVCDLHTDCEYDIPNYALCSIIIDEDPFFTDITKLFSIDMFKQLCNEAYSIYEKNKYPCTGEEGEE
jgi:hypothetical protein